MPQVVARAWVPIEPALAFAVSQTTGAVRMRWDPFIRSQRLVGAERPGKGVRTRTRTRLGPAMESEYVSYRPPTSVGMTMLRGPWFLASFGGGWRFAPEQRDGVDGTLTTWKYTYAVRPTWLRPVAEPIGQWLLGREIRHRIAGFATGCADPVVLEAARADLARD
ncbi:SRPBCC family protein [Agrococcus sp. ARC_14]|uniref:SRPBCC family protein n=1 Tax=Agrococcus sp. ARC_14 TaxID=2919927 RepID=UPI001F0524A0|nr:SRPBCC family protein [Agrococcus sp. ARC_14]MCH1884048.1 SRPBCC family protein [Agrococcus sp. ARC_14]